MQGVWLGWAHWRAELNVHAGEQRVVLVLKHATHENCRRLRVYVRGYVVDLATMGKSFFVHQANLDRDFLKLNQ